jgi:hypothetical protein
VAFGFVGFAFRQNKNESREHLNARNKTAPSEKEVANLAKQESRPDRTAKGYARICVVCWWTEGEGNSLTWSKSAGVNDSRNGQSGNFAHRCAVICRGVLGRIWPCFASCQFSPLVRSASFRIEHLLIRESRMKVWLPRSAPVNGARAHGVARPALFITDAIGQRT